MTQFSKAATCAAQLKMGLFEVFFIIYLTAVCAAQGPQDVTPLPTVIPTVTPLPIVIPTEPPVPVLQLQSAWLDVFPSEKVELNCSVGGSSDWIFTWYRNEEQLHPASDQNLSFLGDGSVLTFTAGNNPQIYTCKGQHKTTSVFTHKSNPLELQVYANTPKPVVTRTSNFDKMFPRESITFRCTVDVSSGWEYLWYHNSQGILPSKRDTYAISFLDHSHSGQYFCKAKRGKDSSFSTEASETTSLQVSDPPTPTLKPLSPWLDVFEDELVELKCEVNNPDWTITWYKNRVELKEDFVLYLDEDLLNITSVSQTYQGVYACRASLPSRRVSSEFSNTANVTVYENIPKPTLSKQPAINSMYAGETVHFTCKVDFASGWKYQWYKNEHELTDTDKTISISLGVSDGGEYSCKATRSEITSTTNSEKIRQEVLEIPVPSLKPVTQWLDVFPTESVKMSCGMQVSSNWTYTWYKDEKELQAFESVLFGTDGTNLSIISASSSHRGKYSCSAKLKSRSVGSNHSSPLTLTVYDKKPTVTLEQDPEYKVMFPTESVTFTCHIDVSSEWKYMWYKNGSKLVATANTHSISHIGIQDGGSYTCQVKRGIDQVFTTDFSQPIDLQVEADTLTPLMTQQPDVEKLYTGELVTFECTVKISSGWTYHWNKDGAQVLTNSSTFKIDVTRLSDSGTYECNATRDQTMFRTKHSDGRTLHISEIPVPSLKPVTQWLDVFPTESVKMSCGMQVSSNWTYTWYKDEKELQAVDAELFGTDGTNLSISSASSSDRGKYSCSAKLKSRSVGSNHSLHLTLDVYDTKPRAMLMQDPTHSLMHTGDSVSFSCHINVSSGWEYLWYKDGSPLDPFGNNYNISSVVTTHTGSYECQAKRGTDTIWHSEKSQAVRLDVEERPQASIILLTGWSEVFSTDSLVLRCEVMKSSEMWNYTWFKEGQRMDLAPSEKYMVTEQSLYTCQGSRTGRPSYSKSSESFKTQNLLLKRRVLLSISGCLFFGIIAVFLGCIILRVIRKPVDDDDDKPEEANLFLTMAQLKDCADAPYPLAEYITDADLNALPKEGNENGTICSETTLLPITPQEDQAVLTDVQKTTENNGGLVSFQQ